MYPRKSSRSFSHTDRKMTSQASFDDLIACSLAALEPFDTCQARSNMKSSGSIDDFLADYQHERSSIQSFFSSLEEPEPAHLKRCGLKQHISACFLDPAPLSPKLCVSTQPVASFEAAQPTHAETTSCSLKRADTKQQRASVRKTLRSKTNLESKEERRRSKNCEYQRRFREKKMRLEMQRQFMAVCPSACFQPPIHHIFTLHDLGK